METSESDTRRVATVKKPFGDVSIEELTGVNKGNDVVLVNVNRASLTINCGSRDDFVAAVALSEGIKGIVWNEKGITLVMNDRYTVIKYEPVVHALAEIFFDRDTHYDNRWTGEFKEVKFTKIDLIRYLRTIDVYGGTADVVKSIQDIKMREARHEHETISLGDEEKSTSVVEESFQTNIPKKFTLNIPVTKDFIGKFEFETRVERSNERNDRNSGAGNKIIYLRCINPLEVLRDNMQHVLQHLPKEIPRLYGNMEIKYRRE